MFNFNKVTYESLKALCKSLKEAEYDRKFSAAMKDESSRYRGQQGDRATLQ